jgi:GTP-binding protein EngB required for normal cell division
MSAVVASAKRLIGRGADLDTRIEALRQAGESARGRLDEHLVADALRVSGRAAERLSLAGDRTVVALAGSTGSGKSSTFNALAGLDLAGVGVRRPTTSWTMSCAWGAPRGDDADGAGPLLDWLGVPRRHQVSRDGMLDGPRADRDLEGLVLLDLPDHDSTEVAHHVEVDRLVQLADMLVWVLDPQKYADAAVHDRYLKPLAEHRDIMLVVLNHIDEVPPGQREAMLADLRRLLVADGLGDVPVLATSARHGEGIADLRAAIARRVSEKKAVRRRLETDVVQTARRVRGASGDADPGELDRRRRTELVDAFADAAGVPVVVSAVEQATRRRAAQATGWPVTSWLGRLRPDPLRRLHLDLGADGRELTAGARASVPDATPVQRARVDTAVRAAADQVTEPLTPPWAEAVRRASVSRLGDLDDALDRAVSGTELGVSRRPLWWRGVRLVQWLLLLTAAAGAVWLGSLVVLGYLQFTAPTPPDTLGVPVPTLMLLGGVLCGVVLGLLCRLLVGWSARRRGRRVERRLRAAVEEVCDRLVVAPVDEELAAYRATRDALARAC